MYLFHHRGTEDTELEQRLWIPTFVGMTAMCGLPLPSRHPCAQIIVIPAHAGIQWHTQEMKMEKWIPTFVGMTGVCAFVVSAMTQQQGEPMTGETPVPLQNARPTGKHGIFLSFLRVLRDLRVQILCLPPCASRSLRVLRVHLFTTEAQRTQSWYKDCGFPLSWE